MYLEPSWSHTHSAFCAALFLWYWHRTRLSRTWQQWIWLGLISGLMVDVYLANAIFLFAPAVDCFSGYVRAWPNLFRLWQNLRLHLLFAASAIIAFLPMLITRQIVFGKPFTFGMYGNVAWNWTSPNFRAVLFSSKDGLFVCTPILLLAVLGLFALWRLDPITGKICLLITTAFYALISFLPVVARGLFVRQPFLHLIDAHIRIGACRGIFLGRPLLGRFARRCAPTRAGHRSSDRLESRPRLPVVDLSVLPGRCWQYFLERSARQPDSRRPGANPPRSFLPLSVFAPRH